MKEVLITSSILILVLVVARYLLRGKLALRLQYALWLLVAVRLLVPVSFGQSPVSVLALVDRVEQARTVASAPARAPTDPSVGGAPEQADDVYPGVRIAVPGQPDPAPGGQNGPTAVQVVTAVWLVGVGAMGVWFALVNLRFRKKARSGACLKKVEGCPLPVYVSDTVPSPCLLGFFRPAIYLTPRAWAEDEAFRHVMAHELTHARHLDPLWSLVRGVCLCLYWFDPLVWWAASLSRRDCELSCDEGALRLLGEDQRLAYGRTLVGMASVSSSPARLLQTATTMSDRKKNLRERVGLIARKPRMLAVTALCLALVLAVTVGCTFTGARQRSAEERLKVLPKDLAEQVASSAAPEAEGARTEGLLVTYTYTPDAGGAYDGFLLSVYHMDQAGFEQTFIDDPDHSGWDCAAADGSGGYYVTLFPTDVRADPTRFDAYQAVQSELTAWVGDVLLGQPGAAAFDLEGYLAQPYRYEGQHIDAAYYPYWAVTGSRDPVWTLTLSQPTAQGEGGVWGVERVAYADGQSFFTRPKMEDSSADYYAQLQKDADAGGADWALDPVQVCLRFVKEAFGDGHANATEDSFSLGEPYTWRTGGEGTEALQKTLQAPPETLPVTVTGPARNWESGAMTAYWLTADYENRGNGGQDGFLLGTYVLTRGQYERIFLNALGDESGSWRCVGRDDRYYYAYSTLTDPTYAQKNAALFSATYGALQQWVAETMLAQDGVTPNGYEEVAVERARIAYPGAHMDAQYYPYAEIDGSRDVAYQLLLSQPVRQGEGGVWCVERWKPEENDVRPVYPDSAGSAADYYAQLQEDADAGKADWALDPMQVSVAFARSLTPDPVNSGLTGASISLGDIYEGEPGAPWR